MQRSIQEQPQQHFFRRLFVMTGTSGVCSGNPAEGCAEVPFPSFQTKVAPGTKPVCAKTRESKSDGFTDSQELPLL